jgi:L-methionine (R)-S-oxide reductase
MTAEVAGNDPLTSWLRSWIRANGGIAGTIHGREGDQLQLRAQMNIPPRVLEATRTISRGKGMAGLAWQRDQPVQTCNLQADESGDVRPGAKAVDASAAVAIPVHDVRGEVRGVVGIAFSEERDLSDDEIGRLATGAEAAPF